MIEILYSSYLKMKNKKVKKRLSYMFNWSFPMNRPFTLFCLPLLITLLLQFIVLYPRINVAVFLITLSLFLQPLVEEIIFRGIVFGAIIKYAKPKWDLKLTGLVLLQALIFLVPHLPMTKNPLGILLTSIVYGILFVVSKNNVGLSAMVHIANNILVFLTFL
jgi:membrane protease YdiL (CAAX protease family)